MRDLFMAQWLTREAREASTIKRQTPIMCVIGNPPYSGESANKGDWIMGLMEAYKKEPGGKEKLKERNPEWINDDYVKFIRFAEHLIEKTGEGVLGFITNHGYLDNPTFRGMRWHLLNTFDKIYLLDLHGNAKKKEVTPDGQPDKNVFDIQQGVAIIIGVKKKSGRAKKGLAQVYQADFWGGRDTKYDRLSKGQLDSETFGRLNLSEPDFRFTERDAPAFEEYELGFSLSEFLPSHAIGIITKRDAIVLAERASLIEELVSSLHSKPLEEIRQRYPEIEDVAGWSLASAKANVVACGVTDKIKPVLHFPFDLKFTYHSDKSLGFLARPVFPTMRQFYNPNFGLMFTRVTKDDFSAFVTNHMATHKSATRYDGTYIAPLYLYPSEQDLDQTRRVNFAPKLYKRLQTLAKHPTQGTPDEVQVFDYIYGVLHCPAYRTTYAEFLKIDFPRIPWPATPDEFWDISAKGQVLRKLHLMDPATIGPTPYRFEGEGDDVVDKPRFEGGKVWINATQCFDAAPEVSWTFYIGGYQPAQKWLKDRKGRALSFDDIKHYQRILKILAETDRIMKTITMTLEGAVS